MIRPKASVGLHPPGFGPQFQHRNGRSVIDVHGRVHELSRGVEHLDAFLLAEKTGADFVGIDSGFGAKQAHGELFFAHLQGKDPDGDASEHGGISGDAKRQRGFAHARPGRNDDQVGRLKARRQFVQIGVMARHPGDHLPVFLKFFDGLDALLDNVFDLRIAGADAAFGDRKDGRLGLIQDLFDALAAAVAERGDFIGRLDQVPQKGLLVDDFGIGGHIGCRGNHFRKRSQVSGSAHLVELVFLGQEVRRR